MELPEKIQQLLDDAGILPRDITERFIRGAGAGGQKINKTSSTVHLRHNPSGIEVRIQDQRNQSTNRQLAWLALIEKITTSRRDEQQRQRAAREKTRRQKRPRPFAQKQKILAGKRQRAAVKKLRTNVSPDD